MKDCWHCGALSNHESDFGIVCDRCYLLWEEDDDMREMRRWAVRNFGLSHADWNENELREAWGRNEVKRICLDL